MKFQDTVDETITVIDNDNTRKYMEMLVKLTDINPAPKAAVHNGNGHEVIPIPVVCHIKKKEAEK